MMRAEARASMRRRGANTKRLHLPTFVLPVKSRFEPWHDYSSGLPSSHPSFRYDLFYCIFFSHVLCSSVAPLLVTFALLLLLLITITQLIIAFPFKLSCDLVFILNSTPIVTSERTLELDAMGKSTAALRTQYRVQ